MASAVLMFPVLSDVDYRRMVSKLLSLTRLPLLYNTHRESCLFSRMQWHLPDAIFALLILARDGLLYASGPNLADLVAIQLRDLCSACCAA